MAFSQSDLDALDDAIKEGVLKVKFRDKEVTYRSLNEMLRLRDLMEKELGVKPRTQRLFTNHSKGLS